MISHYDSTSDVQEFIRETIAEALSASFTKCCIAEVFDKTSQVHPSEVHTAIRETITKTLNQILADKDTHWKNGGAANQLAIKEALNSSIKSPHTVMQSLFDTVAPLGDEIK